MTAPGITREEELHWLALTLIPGLGTRNAGKLIARFRSPQAIFRASRTELEGAGVSGAVAQSLASGCSFEDAVVQQGKMMETGTVVVTLNDPRYPALLREIYDPPVVLFARGRVELLQGTLFGVVGTRRPTPYGLAATERLSGDLARAGLVIVSGMARGIDTAAHKSALSAQGDTIAVLGCGVDVVYPTENRNLATELASKGLILSEFARRDGFSTEFPHPQPYYQRDGGWAAGGRGRAIQRVGDHGPAGHRPGEGSLRGAGQYHVEDELGS
jgi:DNA processing protein